MTEPGGPIDWARHYAAAHEQAAINDEAPPERWVEDKRRPVVTVTSIDNYEPGEPS